MGVVCDNNDVFEPEPEPESEFEPEPEPESESEPELGSTSGVTRISCSYLRCRTQPFHIYIISGVAIQGV